MYTPSVQSTHDARRAFFSVVRISPQSQYAPFSPVCLHPRSTNLPTITVRFLKMDGKRQRSEKSTPLTFQEYTFSFNERRTQEKQSQKKKSNEVYPSQDATYTSRGTQYTPLCVVRGYTLEGENFAIGVYLDQPFGVYHLWLKNRHFAMNKEVYP